MSENVVHSLLSRSELDVYGRLIRLFLLSCEEETLKTAAVILELCHNEEGRWDHLRGFLQGGCVPTAIRVLEQEGNEKEQALRVLNESNTKEHLHISDGLPLPCAPMVRTPALLKVIQRAQEEGREESEELVLIPAVHCLFPLAKAQEAHRHTAGMHRETLQLLTALVDQRCTRGLLCAVCEATSRIIITQAIRARWWKRVAWRPWFRDREVQLGAVRAVHRLVEGNEHAQKSVEAFAGPRPFLLLLKNSRAGGVQEAAMETIWCLAGEDLDDQRSMAVAIGQLVFLAVTMLGGLAQGSGEEHAAMAGACTPQFIARVLRSNGKESVMGAVRTLRHACLGVGFSPHPLVQGQVVRSGGVALLLALLTLSCCGLLRREAAWTHAVVTHAEPSSETSPPLGESVGTSSTPSSLPATPAKNSKQRSS
ncbi:hypothetical protein AAFF_G00395800 [Aldrovandia affinis]|uniref:Uncharacterized protein n=1 Tax=Aldrovandia affinis TaxID=143900 RepID=A0AAD7SD85_9TELE|nr:hypothetical protein AAFF_G00395800 [Aldrovandia affinis]